MQKHGIKADVRQKKRSRKKEQQQYQEDNLLERKFIQIAPNLIWVSDTTGLTYGRNNKVRLHVVLDLYGRYVLSYHISPTETAYESPLCKYRLIVSFDNQYFKK